MNRSDDEEYADLRKEVLLRVAIQNATLLLLAPLFLASVGVAAAHPGAGAEIGLAYVGAAGMSALYWIHSAARTVQIKAYLRVLETRRSAGPGWEAWLASSTFQGILGSRWFISTKAVFIGSQLAAIVICGAMLGDWHDKLAAISLSLLATMLTAILLIQPKLTK